MTDENQAAVNSAPEQTTDVSTATVNTETATPDTTTEKVVPQHAVDALIGGTKKKSEEVGYQKGYEAAKTELNQSLNTNTPEQAAPASQNVSAGSPDEIERIISEQLQARETKAQADQSALKFEANLNGAYSKLESDEKKTEFVEALKPLQLGQIPMTMVNVLNSIDNSAEVLYDIATRCPEKFPEIVNTVDWNPELARRVLLKVSDSIKANKEAAAQPRAPEPLSQIKSSTAGIDNGKMTVTDYKKIYRG